MEESLKNKAAKGMIWSALDKFAVQAGQLVIGIILARLLMPEDFGLIGMLSIFLAISQSFIDSGMGSGLIQKKERSDLDFSTVFVFNLAVSIIFYLLLFIAAPLIALFYETPGLVTLTRVLGLNIIINALAIVQRSKLVIHIDFKTIAKVNVISVFSSGAIAVYFAFTGWGVWALVFQNLIRSLISVALFWVFTHWKPSLIFSTESFKRLFGFGSKLLISGLYAQGFNEIYNVMIGKVYSAADLGYYTRSKQFAEISSGTVTAVVQQVTYPILASLQDDKERLVSVFSRLLRMTSFLIFPAMTLLALMADPLVMLFLTAKWAPAIVLLQWLCFARLVTPISSINMNILNAVGRSDLFLKVDLSKAPIVIAALLITIPMGVKAIVIGSVVTSALSFIINTYMPGKLFGYGTLKQVKEMIPVIIATCVMALSVYLAMNIFPSHWLKIVTGLITALATYLPVSYLLKIEELQELKRVIRKIATGKL
ncbi:MULTISPECIES: lipopolysaccharide biosynthesis protein [Proteiniphilum]|uniref:lipopolysaccharide biosynthesis protein n=1 Tax=Proteiniphilum TaxID=294702 RepID=UPI001EEBA8F8|nr:MULTISPECIES: lipopolysaccharide biosynthesis protein [Proteiniphilum]ULB33639.1 lipopolysaccharide biosynthesis protein [Proteiniphilum propionicum]